MQKIASVCALLALAATCAFAQATAPAPGFDAFGSNQAPNGGVFLKSGSPCVSFTACGWAFNTPTCMSIDSTTSHSAGNFSAKFLNCSAANDITTLEASNIAVNSEEGFQITFWVKTSNVNITSPAIWLSVFDNTHGGVVAEVSPAFVSAPSVTTAGNMSSSLGQTQDWRQMVETFYGTPIYHDGDTNLQFRFQIATIGPWVLSTAKAPNFQILDGTTNCAGGPCVEQVTTAGTSGASTPSWSASLGGTTTDGTVTWTNEGPEGPIWIADIQIQDAWRGLHTFLEYPDYRGYLWSDVTPPARYSPGVTPVAGQIDGASEVNPSGATMATVAGCGSGVIATVFNGVASAKQYWNITPAQYGTLTVGTNYWICSALSGTATSSYPDLEITYENPAFRAGLFNYYDANGTWFHNGVPTLLQGVYERYDSVRGLGLGTSYATWELNYAGNGPISILPSASGSPAPTRPSAVVDYRQSGFDSVIDFAQLSAVNPTSPSAPPGDELTPRLNLFSDFGETHWQDYTYFFGCLETQTTTCAPPAFSVSPTVGAGSITSNFLFLEYVAAAAAPAQGNSPTKPPGLTLPSTPVTVNLSTGGCAGVNCGITLTTPACVSVAQLGGVLYAALGSTSTPPTNSAFSIQSPSWTGQQYGSQLVPCGTPISLSSFSSNTVAPPTLDNTSGGQPNWRGSATDSAIYTDFNTVMCTSSFPGGTGGFYIGDESAYSSLASVFYFDRNIFANCPSNPVAGVLIGPQMLGLFRDHFDIIGVDPYPDLFPTTANDYATSTRSTRTCTAPYGFYTFNNVIGFPSCFPDDVDISADLVGRETYGARPTWMVVRQFGNASDIVPNYNELRVHLWKALIGCQNWGSTGCGLWNWGWVGSSGMEVSIYSRNNPSSWADSEKAVWEIKNLALALLTPVADSSQLSQASGGGIGGGTTEKITGGVVVSGVSIGASTVASVCNNQAGQTSIYTNATLFPFGPARFLTHTYTQGDTDQFLFVTNLCDAAVTVTFNLASLPVGQTQVEVLYEGRTIPIQTSGCPLSAPACFTDIWASLDVHQYAIRSPRTGYIGPARP